MHVNQDWAITKRKCQKEEDESTFGTKSAPGDPGGKKKQRGGKGCHSANRMTTSNS